MNKSFSFGRKVLALVLVFAGLSLTAANAEQKYSATTTYKVTKYTFGKNKAIDNIGGTIAITNILGIGKCEVNVNGAQNSKYILVGLKEADDGKLKHGTSIGGGIRCWLWKAKTEDDVSYTIAAYVNDKDDGAIYIGPDGAKGSSMVELFEVKKISTK